MSRTSAILAFLVAAIQPLAAQPPREPAPPGEIIGVSNFVHIVADLDASLSLYRDLLGLEVYASQPFALNPAIETLGATPGGQSRYVALRVPGLALGVELIEYKDIDRTAQRPHFVDPGAGNLALRVRDLDALFAQIVKIPGVNVLTADGNPVTIETPNGSLHAVFLQDPDGFVIELLEADTASAAGATGPVVGGGPRSKRPCATARKRCVSTTSFWASSSETLLTATATPGAR